MKKYSLKENRIMAFIYIEDSFYLSKFHTECVTQYLKNKHLIKQDNDLYRMLNNKKTEPLARQWTEFIDKNCIFGEISIIDNEISIVVFDNLTDYGIEKIKSIGFKRFKTDKLYYAHYSNSQEKFKFVKL